jgi:hypothetical protein
MNELKQRATAPSSMATHKASWVKAACMVDPSYTRKRENSGIYQGLTGTAKSVWDMEAAAYKASGQQQSDSYATASQYGWQSKGRL